MYIYASTVTKYIVAELRLKHQLHIKLSWEQWEIVLEQRQFLLGPVEILGKKGKVSSRFLKLMCDQSKMTSTTEHKNSQSLYKLIFKLCPSDHLCIKHPEKMQFICKVLLYSCRGLSSWLKLLLLCNTIQTKQLHIQHGDNKGMKERRTPVFHGNRRKVMIFTANCISGFNSKVQSIFLDTWKTKAHYLL